MSNISVWMVRAGKGSRLISDFEKGYVAVGWEELGDMSRFSDPEEMKRHYIDSYPDVSKQKIHLGFAMFLKFHSVISVGDSVVTYDAGHREYLVGVVTGDYQYQPGIVEDYAHIRTVEWKGRVSRDTISTPSKNSLGSVLTLFSVNEDVWAEIQTVMAGEGGSKDDDNTVEDDGGFDFLRKDTQEKAHEFIKDRILKLTPDEMEELTAAMLRGMGYRTRVSPTGPDRGVDVLASPDGLGLEQPRIKAEVKHRPKTSMGSSEIRSFLGGLREGDKAIYVSTGGFSKDARYEAERSTIPLTLIDLDYLATLIVNYYENFDLEGRALIPLVRVYWPAD